MVTSSSDLHLHPSKTLALLAYASIDPQSTRHDITSSDDEPIFFIFTSSSFTQMYRGRCEFHIATNEIKKLFEHISDVRAQSSLQRCDLQNAKSDCGICGQGHTIRVNG
jgi:hypothetical protein